MQVFRQAKPRSRKPLDRYRPLADFRRLRETCEMKCDKLLAGLQSPVVGERITATYDLDYDEFEDPRILAAVRANLGTDDADLMEITVMRLLVRGKDIQSGERVSEVLKTTRDDLVFSACVRALSNLAREHPETGPATLQTLDELQRQSLSPDDLALLDRERGKLRQLLARC
jgi:hypothetical protein